MTAPSAIAVDLSLYWLPLGAGSSRLVRASGRAYEAWSAWHEHRHPAELYHAALRATIGPDSYVIEVAPAWDRHDPGRGVVAIGPVGLSVLGRSRWFRYEVRCWRGGTIPDASYAVDCPISISTDTARVERLLDVVRHVPTPTWGGDQLEAGEMWNSNSVIAWSLLESGHGDVPPPIGGRAPGWGAGVAVAGRSQPSSVIAPPLPTPDSQVCHSTVDLQRGPRRGP